MTDDTNFEDAQKLSPEGEVVLFEIITAEGASVFVKSGPELTYLGDVYESVPCSLGSEKKTAVGDSEFPTFSVGGDNLDLSALKPALFSGQVDGGTLRKHVVEINDLLANVNTKITTEYRIKQITDYNRYKISMTLARFSPSSQTTIPYVKYLRPHYPHVSL